MPAYSFKLQFVNPIRLGLGLDPLPELRGKPLEIPTRPKRQTIREIGKRRHVREGENITLYTAQRTKWCTLLGVARCSKVRQIRIQFGGVGRQLDFVTVDENPPICSIAGLDDFAADDGFKSWDQMLAFWTAEHPGVTDFRGLLIRWEPQ